MLRRSLIILAFIAANSLTGCGGGDTASSKPEANPNPKGDSIVKKVESAEEKKLAGSEKAASAKSNPAGNENAASTSTPKPDTKTASRKTGLSNLFKVPEIPQEMLITEKPLEKPVETTQAKIQPKVRLLGFVKIDGVRKALIELGSNVHSVAPGDVIDGVEVIEIVNDQVTFQFVSARWTTPLFKQDWMHEQTGGGSIAARATTNPVSRGASFNRSFNASSKPAANKTPKSPFSSTRPDAGQSQSSNYNNEYQATGGNIPGIPGVSSSGSIPGMPATSSEASGSPATSTPGGAPGSVPGAPGSTPSGAPSSVPGGTPGGLPGGLPGALPGATPGGVPGGTPGGLPTGT